MGKISPGHRSGQGRAYRVRVWPQNGPTQPRGRCRQHLLCAARFSSTAGHIRNTLQSRRKSLDIIQQRFDKGIITELDLNQAQIQKEIAAAAIPLYQRSIAKTENALSILLGRLPESIETGIDLNSQTLPPDIPTGLPSNLLERRPDVLESLYLLKAQTENIGVAEALRFPAISLTGALGIARTDLGGLVSRGGFWSLGGSLSGTDL